MLPNYRCLFRWVPLILLWLFCSAHAEIEAPVEPGVQFNERIRDQHWQVFFLETGETDTLRIKKEKSDIDIQFASDSRAHGFLRVYPLDFGGEKDVMFATIWGKGAHGETIRVLNPRLGEGQLAEVYYYHSAWPLELELKDGELVIHGLGDMTDEGIPEEQRRIFRP